MMLGSCTLKEEKTSNIDKYPEYLGQVAYAEEYMPNIEQCGNYSSMLATYKKSGVIIFVTDTVGLFLSYNEDEYYEQKEEMLSSFEFFYPEDEELESDCDAVVDGYNIHLVKQEYPLSTYKMGLLIGMNDQTQKICYLYYYDFDLDILDDLDLYVRTYFSMP